jgi:hypothetical protein
MRERVDAYDERFEKRELTVQSTKGYSFVILFMLETITDVIAMLILWDRFFDILNIP